MYTFFTPPRSRLAGYLPCQALPDNGWDGNPAACFAPQPNQGGEACVCGFIDNAGRYF